ncbi:uncharacterized protein LOC132296828 [Cornus florida]|uniref:uncharacterized protein LOC132296828 n=1 Tax=Cornus florida TaxID=4283 RepID=UPI00289D7A39|nr:uncharacterized protein LOC132296828 [Cornus florida]
MESSEEEMNIYLKVIKTIPLNVKRMMTIKNVKATFRSKEGISENLQELFLKGERLQDDKKLFDYGIKRNSTLHLVLQASGAIKLLINIPSHKKTVEVEAKPKDTIQNIKLLIQAKEGIQSDKYTLIYSGKLLEDNRTLASLEIQDESTLHLVFNPRDLLSISVKMPFGEIMKPEVKVLYTVRDVKDIIGSMLRFPVADWNLIFAGMQLENSKTLAFYNITEECILEMLPPTIQIFVKKWSGETITLDVGRQDTVKDVKEKLLIQSDKYTLIYSGKLLEDNRTLASLEIQDESTLHLVRDLLSVSVKMPSGEIMKPEVKVLYTVRDVKDIIGSMVRFPVADWNLIFAGMQLENSKTLAFYNITEECILEMLPPTIQIFVKNWSGETITLDVGRQDTVKDVKEKLFDKLGLPVEVQSLVFAGRSLENDCELASYNIQKDSTLNISFWPTTLVYKAKLSEIGDFSTGVLDTTTIGDLKALVREKVKKPVKEAFLRGKALKDQVSLADNAIEEDTQLVFALEVR